MIINTGQRTDIPAYYSKWFLNRIKEGFVLVRNPYYPEQVTRYALDPKVVDVLSFCTKNPEPILSRMDALSAFRQFWFVTITPYDRDIEPNVPETDRVIDSFKKLSGIVGAERVGWRYDPIFITEQYAVDFHINAFDNMAKKLAGSTGQAVISFIDLYEKTKRNFPEARAVTPEERTALGEAFARTARKYGITVRACCEGTDLARFGIDVRGCLTQAVLEKAVGERFHPPKRKGPRPACECLLGNDIGMYNTCPHLCKYCYANYDKLTVMRNIKLHDPASPFLIGNSRPEDIVRDANQRSFIENQVKFF